jgi:hypothetical protein
MKQIEKLHAEIKELREALLNHRLYHSIESLHDIQVFTMHHVFAVWDFMSLLKAMQKELTCVNTPWKPVGNAKVRRMINEIVLGEESDTDQYGNPASHFELYLDAMTQAGASTQQILNLINKLSDDTSVMQLIDELDLDEKVKEFLRFTFSLVEENKIHKIAAAFTFGREDLIPDLFRGLVYDINKRFEGKLDKMIYYLDRHIQVDDGVHGPLAIEMIEELCQNDEVLWKECIEVSKEALEKRIRLWDAIALEIEKNKAIIHV